MLKKLKVLVDNSKNKLAIIRPLRSPRKAPKILSSVCVITFIPEILPATKTNIKYIKIKITTNEIKLRRLCSNLKKPKKAENSSWYLVATKNPVMMPIREKILLSRPFFKPSKVGINIIININMSREFNQYQ